jgi:hypothetical protein
MMLRERAGLYVGFELFRKNLYEFVCAPTDFEVALENNLPCMAIDSELYALPLACSLGLGSVSAGSS